MIKNINPDSYYTVSEVSQILGIIEEQVRRHIRSNKLKANKQGRGYVIPGQAIINYLSHSSTVLDCYIKHNTKQAYMVIKSHNSTLELDIPLKTILEWIKTEKLVLDKQEKEFVLYRFSL